MMNDRVKEYFDLLPQVVQTNFTTSQRRDSTPQPSAYDAPAPPLRHVGKYDAFGGAPYSINYNIPHA